VLSAHCYHDLLVWTTNTSSPVAAPTSACTMFRRRGGCSIHLPEEWPFYASPAEIQRAGQMREV
jgi:hypothetical protein